MSIILSCWIINNNWCIFLQPTWSNSLDEAHSPFALNFRPQILVLLIQNRCWRMLFYSELVNWRYSWARELYCIPELISQFPLDLLCKSLMQDTCEGSIWFHEIITWGLWSLFFCICWRLIWKSCFYIYGCRLWRWWLFFCKLHLTHNFVVVLLFWAWFSFD